MNTDTKRHIDAARQVLVGVVPNPTSQIDQITTALIYKFMDDMDQASVKVGGEPAFFVGDLEKYAWTRIMDSRLGNQERMNLYAEALVKFSESKQLPELFRGIFKSAYLPYRSPETLGLFLKEIGYFDYSHPEELGNAYEYLLSIMSSQGDAGQFRTPRHIIDFMVDVVNPTKDDKVLDPACGTGGFLIKSFLHILEQHDGKSDPDKKEKPLTPDERKKMMGNFEGYDIDPGMVRIAQVNMYLHQFKNPKIFQYDSLSQDERWYDKFDVILANPPFMSPKGGISPHSKFSIQSSRSEVLFVDYIMNHLKPNGRAAVIVPEGIIFQSGKGHTELRKNLINDGLYAIVSLPSGVFNPYAGVKTSILFFDNELAKQKSEILFIKVGNDGFDLGAQRRPSTKNDLPEAISILNSWTRGEKVESKISLFVEKSIISKSSDYNLSGDRYIVTIDHSNAKWPVVNFDDVVSTLTPPAKIPKEHYKTMGNFPIIDQSQDKIAGWTNDETTLVKSEKPLVIFGDHTCAVKYTEKSFAQGADGIKILLTNEQLIPKYFYYILKTRPVESEGYKRHFSKLKRYEIPLPPLEFQEKIVAELDGYASIISGAKHIIKNWKPKIEIDPKWERLPLGELCETFSGGTPSRNVDKYWNGDIPWVKTGEIKYNLITSTEESITKLGLKESSTKLAEPGTILLALYGQGVTRGRVAKLGIKAAMNQACLAIIPKEKLNNDFLLIYLQTAYDELRNMSIGGNQSNLSANLVRELIIPIPPMEVQEKIALDIGIEKHLVEMNKKLIKIYQDKIQITMANLYEHNN